MLLDRATMAQVHGDFLGDATVTDVITFPYGEILICPAVAWETAAVNGLSMPEELLLYLLHGVLHLTGYEDKTPAGAQDMAAAQEKLLRKVLTA